MLHESLNEKRGQRNFWAGILGMWIGGLIFIGGGHAFHVKGQPNTVLETLAYVLGALVFIAALVLAIRGSVMTRKSAFAKTSFGLAQTKDAMALARKLDPYKALAQKEKAVQKCVEAGLADSPGDVWLALIPAEIRSTMDVSALNAEEYHRTLAAEIAANPIEPEVEVREDTDDSDWDDDIEDYDTYVPTSMPAPEPPASPSPASVPASSALSGLIKGMGG